MGPYQPPLICRLRAVQAIGRQGPIPHLGEVELENCSAAPLRIEYTMTPLQFLELEVVGPEGHVVSEGHFSDRFSPTREAAVLHLQPGEKFRSTVPLLATLPVGKRRPGRYVVQGAYCYLDQRVRAAPVTVDLV